MTDRYPPVNPKCPHFLHGGDYNPDQWPQETWDDDMRLMKLAACNAMSVGIFSWSQLQPAEDTFTFDWLDRIMDKLDQNGLYAVLATPSAAQPAWMSARYPEILRAHADGRPRRHGRRVNYCLTNPIYREKVRIINTQLAERYKGHRALLVWHVSNEYGGECHCPLCYEAFRQWLQGKYGTLAAINGAWWTAFWGHRYDGWSQIHPCDQSIHGLQLDWRRFVTRQTIDFFKNEIGPLRELTPDVPITTNFMGVYPGLDYRQFAREVDVVSWDSYPPYHDREGDWKHAVGVSFVHDLNRGLKGGRPFMLMECSPSVQNWKPVNKLKRPGLHRTEALQAVAHGADTVQYFQWRKGRGGCEKFHGAVVDHVGHENTRVFGEVAALGADLAKLDAVIGTTVSPKVAIVYDWQNRWAIDAAAGPRNERKDYLPTCVNHYRPFWSRGVGVDVIGMEEDFHPRYKLLIAPMLYMLRPGVAERIQHFVADGGVFVTTYLCGIADQNDLVFTGGFPGPLRQLLGIWAEEIDVLYDDESNRIVPRDDNGLDLTGEYEAGVFCDLIHAETAEVLAEYVGEFYAYRPALTVNRFKRGAAFYIASRNDERFLDDFYAALIRSIEIPRILETDLPEGVTAQMRTDGQRLFIFLLNFTRQPQTVDLGDGRFVDVLNGSTIEGCVTLDGYATLVLERT